MRLNIIRIIAQINKDEFSDVNNLKLFLQIVEPYANALFHIYQNKDYSFWLLTRSYRRYLPNAYNILCSSFARASYLVRDAGYSDDERRLVNQQEEIRQAKIMEFHKNFDKKRMRTDMAYTFQS